jgi:hypothetical protein
MDADLTNLEEYLESARIPLRLACKTESGWPVAVSLWFKHREGVLLCATQKTARVVSYLKNDPRCAYEIASDLPPYCGVRGQAIARIDEKIGAEILEGLLVRYLGSTDNALGKNLLTKSDQEVAIILKPINVYTWDFSGRMEEVLPPMLNLVNKVCP